MAKPINLLPAEFAPTGVTVKLLNLLRTANLVGFTIFILVVAGAISLFVINAMSIQASRGRQETLKNSINSLEATEQRVVLLSDRVKIAKTILSKDSATDGLAKLSLLLPNISGSVSLAEAEIISTQTKFSILASNSSDLARFMAALVSGDFYQKINLSSLSFSPTLGYLASFEVNVK